MALLALKQEDDTTCLKKISCNAQIESLRSSHNRHWERMKHSLKHMQKNTAERLSELFIRLEPARLVKKQPGSTYNELQPIFPSPLRRHMHQAPSVSNNCLPNVLLLLTSLAVGILDYAVSPKLCRRVLVLREFRT
jgi:hypothetical protein